MKYLLTVLLALTITGCTMQGSLDESDKNKVFTCTDFRDNTKFSFNSNTITNIRVGFGAETCLDFIKFRDTTYTTVCGNTDSYLKCEKQ